MDKMIKNGHQNELFPSIMIICHIIYHVCTKCILSVRFFSIVTDQNLYPSVGTQKKKNIYIPVPINLLMPN